MSTTTVFYLPTDPKGLIARTRKVVVHDLRLIDAVLRWTLSGNGVHAIPDPVERRPEDEEGVSYSSRLWGRVLPGSDRGDALSFRSEFGWYVSEIVTVSALLRYCAEILEGLADEAELAGTAETCRRDARRILALSEEWRRVRTDAA